MVASQNIYAALAALAGVCLAVQAAANGAFRRNLDTPLWATFFSVCGTILFAGAAMLAIRPPAPAMELVRGTSWWNWVGGPLGTLIVLSGAFITPRLGAATFLAFVIAGQLSTAVVVDHYALMGVAERALTPGRLAGVVLVLAGALCIKYL